MTDAGPELEGFDLTGRRVVVTGGSQGIGGAIATRLAAAGASVVAISRSGSVPPSSPGVRGLALDLSDSEDVERAITLAVEELGGLDVLVNNAAAAQWRAALSIDRPFFDHLIDLNLWTPLRLSQLAQPHLRTAGGGAIVMIGSIDATRPSAGAAIYGATKAGLAALTVTLAKEWATDAIRVVQVDPGLVDTPMAGDAVEAVGASDAAINLAGRVGRPDEIAGLVHYLVSPLGGFVSGASLRVDGGALTLGPFDQI